MISGIPIVPPQPPQPPSRSTTSPAAPQPPSTASVPRISPRGGVRVTSPDLTGLYESVPIQENENSAVMLQLNQAGKVLVGWFSGPPAFVRKDISPIMSRPYRERNDRMPFGVLMANLEYMGANGCKLKCLMSSNSDAATLDPEYILDSDRVATGLIKVVKGDSPELVSEVLIRFDWQSQNFDRFIRVKQTARWSVNSIGWMPSEVRDILIGEQVAPIPSSYVDKARHQAAPLGDVGQKPPVAGLIELWMNEDDTDERRKLRGKIADELRFSALQDTQTLPRHRIALAGRIRAHAASKELKVLVRTTKTEVNKSYLAWYETVMREEMADKSPLDMVVRVFKDLGIEANQRFRYTMTFNKISLGGKFIVGFGGSGFSLDIKKELVEFKTDFSGNEKLDKKGEPIEKSVAKQWDTAEGKMGHLGGFFGDVGIGLGFSLSVSGGGILGNVTFNSPIDIKSLDDFDLATFSIASVKGPGADMGHYISFDTFTSKHVEFHLKGGRGTLYSTDTESVKFDPPKAPTANDLKDPSKYLKGWTTPKLDGKFFDVSMGWGFIKQLDSGSGGISRVQEAQQSPTTKEHNVQRRLTAFFEHNSADLDQPPPPLPLPSPLPPLDRWILLTKLPGSSSRQC